MSRLHGLLGHHLQAASSRNSITMLALALSVRICTMQPPPLYLMVLQGCTCEALLCVSLDRGACPSCRQVQAMRDSFAARRDADRAEEAAAAAAAMRASSAAAGPSHVAAPLHTDFAAAPAAAPAGAGAGPADGRAAGSRQAGSSAASGEASVSAAFRRELAAASAAAAVRNDAPPPHFK